MPYDHAGRFVEQHDYEQRLRTQNVFEEAIREDEPGGEGGTVDSGNAGDSVDLATAGFAVEYLGRLEPVVTEMCDKYGLSQDTGPIDLLKYLDSRIVPNDVNTVDVAGGEKQGESSGDPSNEAVEAVTEVSDTVSLEPGTVPDATTGDATGDVTSDTASDTNPAKRKK